MNIKSIAAVITLMLSALASSQATVLINLGGAALPSAGYGQVAINFRVNTTVSATDLQFFGVALGGGDTPYVQLWNDDSDTLLGSVSWGPGVATNGWNTLALSAPVTLTAGTNYQVQASAYWVNEYASAGGFTYGAEIDSSSISFLGNTGWTNWTPPLAPTTLADSTPAPMLNVVYSAVPEPSTYALLGAGLLSLVFLKRRARNA